MFINPKLIYALVVALLLAITAAGVQTVRLASEKQEHAETIAKNEREWSQQYKTAAVAAYDTLDLFTKRTEALQKEADNAKQQRDKANADADANARTGKQLRGELAAARTRICATKTESASVDYGSKATQATIDLFDDVQRRLDEATDSIAQYADSARIAGDACERSYDSLNTGLKSWVIDENPSDINQALTRQIDANQSPTLNAVIN